MSEFTMMTKFKPAVSRDRLYALAALLWAIAGLILCYRSFVWLTPFSAASELGIEMLSAIAAVLLYVAFFSAIVHKNIERIGNLPERVCAFAFTPWRGYGMIVLMMALGITFRNSDIPKVYLAVPFSIMGMMLLIGGAAFLKRFINNPLITKVD